MSLNVLNDLAEAMKALDGKKTLFGFWFSNSNMQNRAPPAESVRVLAACQGGFRDSAVIATIRNAQSQPQR